MRFAQTKRIRWRFSRDAQTVSYHPSSGQPSRPCAALPQHRWDGHSDHLCPDRFVYVVGLILLDGRQTQTRVALFLPGRAHDALNRLLRVMPLSTRALMRLLIALCKGRRHQEDGYLCLDDVVIEKAFAKKLPWAGWTYSFAKKRKVYGLHVVVLLWCACEGRGFRIPVAF